MTSEKQNAADSYHNFSEFYDLYVGDFLDDLPYVREICRAGRRVGVGDRRRVGAVDHPSGPDGIRRCGDGRLRYDVGDTR